MAQFDVFRNPGRQLDVIPLVIVPQSTCFERSLTRFVVPLVLQSAASVREHYLAPRFVIERREVVLDVFNQATLLANRLGDAVAVLADDESRSKIMRALDEFLSQA